MPFISIYFSNTNTRNDFTASTTYVTSSASESLLPESRHDSTVATTHSTTSTQETILNQTSLKKVRVVLQQMATSQRYFSWFNRKTHRSILKIWGKSFIYAVNVVPHLPNFRDLISKLHVTKRYSL